MEKKAIHSHYGEIFLEWKYPEFPRYERGVLWYFFSGLFLAFLMGYAILTINFLFAIIIALFAILFYLFHRNVRDISVRIAQDGILLNNKLYAYHDIEKFWIIYQPPEVKSLYFQLKGFFSPPLILLLEDKNPNEVRNILLKYIPEDLSQEEEPPIDALTRGFKL